MKNLITVFFVLLAFTACKPDPDDFEIGRRPFTGNRPRIDGYYYLFYIEDRVEFMNSICFYRNGTSYYAGTLSSARGEVSLKAMDEYLLKNNQTAKNEIDGWGVFQVNGADFKLEQWVPESPSRRIGTFIESGKVTSDTTILIDIGPGPSATYTFRKFSPKPDSTNCYIK